MFRSLWDQINELAHEQRLFSPVEVLLELGRGGNDIYKWAKERMTIFLEVDEKVEEVLTDIVNRFPSFIPDTSNDGIWADAHIVAFAAARKWTVVTGEKLAPRGAKRLRIPNICQVMGVQCIDLLNLIRYEGWHF